MIIVEKNYMAELVVENDELILKLSVIEKAEAIHGDLHVHLTEVQKAEIIDDALEMTRIKTGFKVGMRAPGYASVAVIRRPGHKAFVAVHHDTPKAIRVTLANDSYNEWVVGVADPESVLANLNLKK